MALFFEGQECPLCEEPITENQPKFGTWGVWLPSMDRLQRYCDAVLHWDCYAKWKHRERFARSYFQFWVEHEQHSPYWYRAYLDDDVYVSVNPGLESNNTFVHLAATGSRHMVSRSNWQQWLQTIDDAEHPIETEALESAKRVLRDFRPTSDSLLQSSDRSSKEELHRRLKEEEANRAQQEATRKVEIAEHNSLCEQVLPVILESGYRCASCGQKKGDFRLATRTGSRSLIVCRQCGDTVDPLKFKSSIRGS